MEQVTSWRADRTDASTFDEFYASEYDWAVRFTTTLIGELSIAEDLAQDSFMKVRHRFSTIENPHGYLRVALTNASISVLRRRRVERQHTPTQPASWIPEHLIEFSDVLQALPARQRAAIVLRYLEDLDDVQIAAVLSCRRSTVRTLVQRGLLKLRKDLKA